HWGRWLMALVRAGEENSSFPGPKQLATTVERSNALVHAVGWRQRADPAGSIAVPRGYSAYRPEVPVARAPVEPPETDQVHALRGMAEASGGHFWEADSP